MTCPRCHTSNPARAKFCLGCGFPLADGPAADGTSPGVSLPDSLKRMMPDEIVRKMASGGGKLVGERRVVTILFCDVKGSTAMADTLDPEDVMEIMNGAFEAMIAPVVAYGGTLARLMGDAILAFFGAPTAHEDDPERACRAALDIQKGITVYADRLRLERGIPDFSVRSGINTGMVVVGEVGNSVRVEYTAMGDAVNLAARMESTAEPGTIRISENTRRLVADTIRTVPLGKVEVKGKSRPVPVYRVTGVKAKHTATRETGDVPASPMVGREKEFGIMKGSVSGLLRGKAAILALTGEAGVGKSRLLYESRNSMPAGFTWLKSRAVPYSASTSYAMVRNLLHSALGVPPDSPQDALAAALEKTIAEYSPDRKDEIYPFLAWLLHLHPDEGAGGRVSRLDAESFGTRLRDSVLTFLSGMAERGPLVLCWEDLHWVDPSSLKTLESLLILARTHPVAFLLVSRPEKGDLIEFYGRVREAYAPYFQMIELDPLGKKESARVVTNMLGGRRIPAALKKQILDKTEGNAFFLEEVVRSIVEEGISPGGSVKGGRSRKGPSVLGVPETVQGVVTARLDRLPEEHRSVLQAASVMGRNFRTSVLESTLDPPPAPAVLRGWLGELEKREFIDRRPAGPDPDPEHTFRHAITQDVVYGTMLSGQRKKLHLRVGDAIERVYAGKADDFASTLSLHFEKAGRFDRALSYTLKAAESSRRSYANREALTYYRKALKFMDSGPAGDTRVAAVHEALGDVLALTALYADAVSHYRRALECRGEAGGGSRAPIHRKTGSVFERWGKYDDADRELQSALRELGSGGDPRETARVNIGLARVLFRRDETERASKLAADALAVMDREGDLTGAAAACSILGNIAFKEGNDLAAISYYGRCLGTWEETEFLEGLAMVYNNLGQIHHRGEEWDVAVVYYTKSLDISRKTGNRYGTARTCDNLSQLYAARGRQDEATRFLRQALDIYREIGKSGDVVVPELWVQSGTL